MRWLLSPSCNSTSSVICLAALVVALATMLPTASAQSIPTAVQQRATNAFHGADQQGKDGPLAKMGTDLTRLYVEYDAHKASGAKRPFTSSNKLMPAYSGHVTIDAVAKQDAAGLLRALQALGLQYGAVAGRMVSGRLPIAAIDDAAALTGLRFARPARVLTGVGTDTTQGDSAMRADEARMLYNVDGSGIKIGVMSDSFDDYDGSPETTASDDITSGDLPGTNNPNGFTTPVEVLDDSEGPEKDEGRAMMQIIHDIAPGAELGFHTAFGGQANFAQGIRDLAGSGADIIVDDVLYLAEPMFQDGQVAQAIDEVKFNDGVAHFSAAGNLADQSYESTFRLAGTAHDFDNGGGVDTLQSITVPKNTTATFILQWDDPFASAGGAGADTDLDIYARDVAGDSIAAESTDPNIGNDAVEILDIENTTGTSKEYRLWIEHAGGPVPNQVKYVYNPGGVGITDDYGDTGKPTLYGHANAKGAEAIAASSFGSTRMPRSYTALGGVPILFDTAGNRQQEDTSRQKPGTTAPDCVSNTFFGNGNTFCGTSAAAPHAAAVAALMLENRSSLTVDNVYGELRANAHDISTGGIDDLTGSGFIDAFDATLPVELVAFDAVADKGDVLLTWTTASETNNAGFRVEQQSAGGRFERIAFVPGSGTTMETQAYQHRVTKLTPGTHTFRLQQVDTDGAVHTSPEVEVAVTLNAPYALSAAYPNPTRSAVQLDLVVRSDQVVRVRAYDALGRHIRTLHNGPVNANEPLSLALQAETLPSGMYLIHVRGELFSASRRATVVH